MKNIEMNKHWMQSLTTAVLLSVLFFSCSHQKKGTDLVVFDGGTVSQKEYIDHFLRSTIYKPNIMPSEDNLRKIVFDKAMEKIAVLEAQSRNMGKNPILESEMSKRIDIMLAQQYMQDQVINKVVSDSLIKKFYDSFTPQYRMRYILRIVSDRTSSTTIEAQKDTINRVYKLLNEGQNFQDLAKK